METESVRRSERGATSVACTFISVVVLYGISGCSRDVRGGAPARGSIASADTPNEFQRHAPDNAPGARTAMGCGAVLNSERCVELALNVAIDPERITEHAVAVQVSTEGGLQPVAVPYGRFFVGVPRGYDTEGRGDRSRSVVVAGTSIPLVDALALSLLPHEQVLSGLRQSVAAWAALSDSALLALRPTIRVALNGDVLGGDGPAMCSANANARCTLRVFERPSGARIADCAFDQSGLCGESLRARRIWGGLALEFTYSTGTAQAPALAEWTLRQEQGSIAAGDRTWSALRRIRCIAGVTPTSACVDGDVLALAPHEMIAGQFVEKPARFGIAIESSLGAAFSVASAAQLLGATVTTLDGDAWSERPVATHFALRPSTASGWPLGAWFDRFECVSRETLIELGARRFDLQGVTQNLVGDHLRRAANDVRTFHVSPVGATSGELSADWQSSPAPMLTVRVMPAVAGEVAEVTATVADLRWTLPRTAGSTTQFATRLTGIVESVAAESEGELAVEARSSTGALIGFDRVMLRLRTRRADSDADGVLDLTDNCPQASNALQEDLDRDGQGDECDDDIDGDTLANTDERRDDTDPRHADTDRDGVRDDAERAAGGALTRDLDRDGIDDGREANGDSDCDSVFDRYDPSNRDVGTSSEPTVFRGSRRATVSVRVTDGASVEHFFTATVVGTTWWLPTERVDESAEEFDLSARAWSVMSAPRNFVQRFVAGRPRTFAEGAAADEQVISALTLTGTGTYSWTNPMSHTVEAFEPTWAMFECGDVTLPRLRRLSPEALREPAVQRCLADALSGATGTLGSAVPGAERTNCPGSREGADWRITDWMNPMANGLQSGVPRIMFCRVPSDGNRRYCEPVQGFSQYGCENGQTCGAGVTLPALLDGIHRRNLAGAGFPLPASLVTRISPEPWTLQAEAGKETVFSSQANSTITVAPTGQFGNWAQVAAVNLGQHTVVDTWTPAVVGVSLRAPDGSVAASNRVATLWPTELDGFLPTLSNPRPAQVVFSAGTLPRSLPPRPPFSFRVSVVEPGDYPGTSVAGTPLVVAGSPAAQVCTTGGPRDELSPGGRDPAVQHRRTVASGFLTPGRATTVQWNGRVDCAAHVVHSGSDYPLGGAGALTPVQLMSVAPLRPGRYTLLVEVFKPVTTGCSERSLAECTVIGGGGTRIRGTELTPGCFAGLPTVTEIPIAMGAEVVVAADADSRGSLSFPDGATINLREAAHRNALTRAVAARANTLLVGDDASLAMRFVNIPVTASRWWRPVQLLTTTDQSLRCAPASAMHRLGVTYSNRLFAEDFSSGGPELGGGCVFLDLPGNEPHRLVQGFGRVTGLPPCPAGGCPFQVISLPQDRAANQTLAGACATVAQAYAPAVLHEGLHSFGWLHSFELSTDEQNLLRTPTSVPVAPPRAESAASLVAGWQRSATRPTSTSALGFSSGQLFSCADLLVRGRPTACDRPAPFGSTSVVTILVPSADIRSSTPFVMSPFTDPAVERGREDRRTTNLRRSVLPFASIRDGAALQSSLPGSLLGLTFDSIEQARRMFGTSWTYARPMNSTSVNCGGP